MSGRLFLLWLRGLALTAVLLFGVLMLALVGISLYVMAAPVHPALAQALRLLFVLTAARQAGAAFLLSVAAWVIAHALCKAFGAVRS